MLHPESSSRLPGLPFMGSRASRSVRSERSHIPAYCVLCSLRRNEAGNPEIRAVQLTRDLGEPLLTTLAAAWPLHPTWSDILTRLCLTVVASALLGLDRGAHGHAAGLRTTILVGLAASVAMIQANILLPSNGKAADSFGNLDLMRMPLGILTGVGFIGGGVILKQGATVKGVTTAATLWVVTAIGLCFGGGQAVVGVAATGIAMLALYALRPVDSRIPRRHHGSLEIVIAKPNPPDLNLILRPLGCRARFVKLQRRTDLNEVHVWFEVQWTERL